MDFWMQRLDSTIEAFRRPRVFRNIFDGQTSFTQLFGRAARRKEFDVLVAQEGAKLDNASLVAHTHESTANGDNIDLSACGKSSTKKRNETMSCRNPKDTLMAFLHTPACLHPLD